MEDLIKEIGKEKNKEKAATLSRFFKTGKGEYGEGDIFLGIAVPRQREIARRFRDMPLKEALVVLQSPFHECRLIALLIMIEKYKEGDEAGKEKIFKSYLRNAKRINNWDLVDLTAPQIVGDFLSARSRAILYSLAGSGDIWERRIAIVSTYAFIKRGEFKNTLEIAEILLSDDQDLIHKAAGWMLREVGKRNKGIEAGFLNKHCEKMPRTMLRYAIEKFPEKERKMYLSKGGKKKKGRV